MPHQQVTSRPPASCPEPHDTYPGPGLHPGTSLNTQQTQPNALGPQGFHQVPAQSRPQADSGGARARSRALCCPEQQPSYSVSHVWPCAATAHNLVQRPTVAACCRGTGLPRLVFMLVFRRPGWGAQGVLVPVCNGLVGPLSESRASAGTQQVRRVRGAMWEQTQ